METHAVQRQTAVTDYLQNYCCLSRGGSREGGRSEGSSSLFKTKLPEHRLKLLEYRYLTLKMY